MTAMRLSMSDLLRIAILVWLALGSPACADQPEVPGIGAFRVIFVDHPDLGSSDRPLPFSATKEQVFTVDIDALRSNAPDTVETGFDGWALLSVQPEGRTTQDPQAVKLTAGRASGVKVSIVMAFGPVRLIVTDVGYVPAAEAGKAACNNRQANDPESGDDDGDGFVDYPKDRGCFYGNDDTETGGTGATGASPVITFADPRLSDVQKPGRNKDASALQGTRVTVDRGVLLITRVSTDGMYVTDYDGAKWDAVQQTWVVVPQDMSYHSAFAFNYSSPINITEGDCLVQLDGTVGEFYGFTELNQPTWKKGDYVFCAAQARQAGLAACQADEATDIAKGSPCRLAIERLANTPFGLTRMVVDDGGTQRSIWDQRYMETERFEAALVQLDDVDLFTELRKCDRNGNGLIDFSDAQEADCSNACGDEAACQVAETYYRYNQWTVSFVDGLGDVQKVSVQSAASLPRFDPRGPRVISDDQDKTLLKPQKLSRLVGTLRHLSFGSPPWILEPRRPSDCPDCKN
jgi:hypothetical protein